MSSSRPPPRRRRLCSSSTSARRRRRTSHHLLSRSSTASVLLLLLLATTASVRRSQALSPAAATNNVAKETPADFFGGGDGGDGDHRAGHRRRLRVVVIGAGVGGLATSARIMSGLSDACQGVEVVVLEKNHRERAGGRCGSFDVDVNGVGNFRHERGPSLLLLKDEYARLFADCGVRNQRGSTIAEAGVGTGGGGEDDDDDEDAAARAYGLETRQCVPAYQVVFDDGDVVPLGFPSSLPGCFSSDEATTVRDAERKSMRMLDSMEPGGYAKWRDYLDTCAAYLDCGLPNFIEGRLDLSSLPRFLRESLRDGGRRWPLAPHSTMLSSLFNSPKLRALASFQDLYVGLEPYANPRQFGGGVLRKTAPAVFGLLAALELHPSNGRAGVHAPVGGFRRVSESMAELCRDLGVEVRYGASVTRVTEDGVHFVYAAENDEASDRGGTEGTGRFLAADLIVCNADVPYATETILRSETDANGGRTTGEDDARSYQETYDWNDELDYSSGVIAFHWSVSRCLEGLSTHNVFMSANATSDAERSWAALRGDDDGGATRTSPMAGTPFNFYVHRAGKTDPTACPPGCDSIMVLVPCPKLTRDERLASLPRDEAIDAYKRQFDREVVDDARDAVFQRLSLLEGLENLEDSILDEVVDTPGSYADNYNVGAGVPFGLSHGLGQLSLTRPAPECKTHGNVLFVGASSRPGNGVPLVLIGSRQVAKKAVDKLRSMIARWG